MVGIELRTLGMPDKHSAKGKESGKGDPKGCCYHFNLKNSRGRERSDKELTIGSEKVGGRQYLESEAGGLS